jgi:hypothetical protein
VCFLAGLLLVAGTAAAQTSASYRLDEYVLNAGGNPEGGLIPASAGFRMTLDALGEGIVALGLASASYELDCGFVSPYLPPREVLDLVLLADDQTLEWSPDRSAGVYHLYRDLLSALSPTNAGACEQPDLPDETTSDGDTTPSGDGYFYLVTAANRLGEEGTRGFKRPAEERPVATPCP